ncbi:tetratricopeptide repeat protein [Sphingomonas sp.]|uniref:tetratricopeptide repeat protein n=1 Tax=Sphingomonas sp. TaxID=28214 RepID=UPI002E0EBF38
MRSPENRVPASQRLDGWKAIGSYLGRERTTVIRWAQTRGLPVHRIPGGNKASVYALKHEIDAWVGGATPENPLLDAIVPGLAEQQVPTSVAIPNRRRWIIGIGAASALTLASGAAWYGIRITPLPTPVRSSGKPTLLPADPQIAALFLQARQDWAERTPASIGRAIETLGEVVRRDPAYAPGYSALADANLLSREFGSTPDVEAFARARTAAQQALRLSGDQAEAHRALGFIAYWWDRDPDAAGQAFRRAVELSPGNAQTHFWYGNILADNGEHRAALRELNHARAIEPGSVAIKTDLAWAYWVAGQDAEAISQLERLAQSNPGFAGIYDCLAEIRLAQRDYPGYLLAFERLARLRNDAAAMQRVRMFRTKLAQGPAALQQALMRTAMRESAEGKRRDYSWPAFIAGLSDSPAQLKALLRTAAKRRERWGNAGAVRRIAERWKGDAEIQQMLSRVRAGPIEQEKSS